MNFYLLIITATAEYSSSRSHSAELFVETKALLLRRNAICNVILIKIRPREYRRD